MGEDLSSRFCLGEAANVATLVFISEWSSALSPPTSQESEILQRRDKIAYGRVPQATDANNKAISWSKVFRRSPNLNRKLVKLVRNRGYRRPVIGRMRSVTVAALTIINRYCIAAHCHSRHTRRGRGTNPEMYVNVVVVSGVWNGVRSLCAVSRALNYSAFPTIWIFIEYLHKRKKSSGSHLHVSSSDTHS